MSSGSRSPSRTSPVQAASELSAASRLASGTSMVPFPPVPTVVPLPMLEPPLPEPPLAPVKPPELPAPLAPVCLLPPVASAAEHPAPPHAMRAITAAPHVPALTMDEAPRIANLRRGAVLDLY